MTALSTAHVERWPTQRPKRSKQDVRKSEADGLPFKNAIDAPMTVPQTRLLEP